MTKILFLLFSLSVPALSENLFSCAQSFAFPTFAPRARLDGSSGEIRVSHGVAADGRAKNVNIRGGGERHREEIEVALSIAKFKKGCIGSEVRYVLEFVVSGERAHEPHYRIKLEGEKIVIVGNPLWPIAHD